MIFLQLRFFPIEIAQNFLLCLAAIRSRPNIPFGAAGIPSKPNGTLGYSGLSPNLGSYLIYSF
jgi:hypothetical protein